MGFRLLKTLTVYIDKQLGIQECPYNASMEFPIAFFENKLFPVTVKGKYKIWDET